MVQWVYESTYYCEGDKIAKQRVKHLRQNLARAANRYNPQYIDITLDEVYEVGESQKWLDVFSGDPLEFTRGGNWGLKTNNGSGACNPFSCSIDRIDQNKGYVKGNIQLVTSLTNFAKGTMTNKEFIAYCKKVAKNH